MSTRTVSDITKQYNQLAWKAGNLQYQIHTLSGDLDMVNKELRDLNLEAAAVNSAEAKAKEEAGAASKAAGGNVADNVTPIGGAKSE